MGVGGKTVGRTRATKKIKILKRVGHYGIYTKGSTYSVVINIGGYWSTMRDGMKTIKAASTYVNRLYKAEASARADLLRERL